MTSENEQRLARIAAESRAHINAARASNQDTRQLIEHSRNAIARSLESLGLRFWQN